jgi:hypothetical protein
MTLPLVVLAAGLSSRYGKLKQLDPLGPDGEAIMDYNIYDAARAGFNRIIMVSRSEIEDDIRAHLSAIVGEALPIDYVQQSLDQLPEGFHPPPDRVRPWGTGHAVLCAADFTDGPFAVCNADDLYGPGAFAKIHSYLTSDQQVSGGALVGYTLKDTLSGSGSVSRGVCVLSKNGTLSHIDETQHVRLADRCITGQSLDGHYVELSRDSIVSMNLWGFTQSTIDHMRTQFCSFLEDHASDTSHEFLLSTAVNGQIQVGSTSMHVLHAEDKWFGVTHASDKGQAQTMLLNQIDQGAYHRPLADGFAALVT